MERRRLLVTVVLGGEERAALEAAFGGRRDEWEIVECARDEAGRHLAEAEILFGDLPRAEVPGLLARAERLRWWQLHFAGVDGVLAHAEARRHPCVLTNASGMHAHTIADHVFMLVLAHFRGLPAYLRAQEQGRWLTAGEAPRPSELCGMTMGVLGLGGIGAEVARRAKAAGMRVIGTRRDPTAPPPLHRPAGRGGGDGLEPDLVLGPGRPDLLSVAAGSDVLVVALPLTAETWRIVDAEVFGRMKRGAFFVNIARGAVVDTAALVDALREERIGGAGLDTVDSEPLPPEHPLWRLKNVIITPHVAGGQRDYMRKATAIFAGNLARYLDGRPLLHVVDKAIGY